MPGNENEISVIDPNFEIKEKLGVDDVVFYDVTKEPFRLYGLYLDEGLPFRRMPEKIAESVSRGVASLNFNTAGGRVRFRTDSPYIAIKAKMPNIRLMSHMPLTGSSGFDLYEIYGNGYYYVKSFIPPKDRQDGYESLIRVNNRGKVAEYEINFPLYNRVDSLEIGLKDGSVTEKPKGYGRSGLILFYGASSFQGGCASRPGTCCPALVSHRLDIDHLNLCFSGSAKGENEMAEYLASVKSSVFMMYYDGNAKDAAHLRNTHLNVYRKYREKNPDTPIVMMSMARSAAFSQDIIKRRQVILDTYYYALDHGDFKVAFIDGISLYSGDDSSVYTVDGVHPNDAGFLRIADAVTEEVSRALNGYFPISGV